MYSDQLKSKPSYYLFLLLLNVQNIFLSSFLYACKSNFLTAFQSQVEMCICYYYYWVFSPPAEDNFTSKYTYGYCLVFWKQNYLIPFVKIILK